MNKIDIVLALACFAALLVPLRMIIQVHIAGRKLDKRWKELMK